MSMANECSHFDDEVISPALTRVWMSPHSWCRFAIETAETGMLSDRQDEIASWKNLDGSVSLPPGQLLTDLMQWLVNQHQEAMELSRGKG